METRVQVNNDSGAPAEKPKKKRLFVLPRGIVINIGSKKDLSPAEHQKQIFSSNHKEAIYKFLEEPSTRTVRYPYLTIGKRIPVSLPPPCNNLNTHYMY
jgi:hypothetical protein